MSANIETVPLPARILQPRELTLKQRLFVQYYCGKARGNGTEAARLAGYAGSDETLGVVGFENIRNPRIKEAINEWFDAQSMHSGEITSELSDIGRAEWRDFLTIRTDDEGNTVAAKLNLGDKIKALDILAKIRRIVGPTQPEKDDSTAIALEVARNTVELLANSQKIQFAEALERVLVTCAGTRAEPALRQLAESVLEAEDVG